MTKNDNSTAKAKANGGKRYRSDILLSLMEAYGWTRDGIQKEMQRMVERGEMRSYEAITLPTVGKILRGENVHVDSLISIARFFDIPLIRLFDFEDELPTIRENNLRKEGIRKYKQEQNKQEQKEKREKKEPGKQQPVK